MLLYNQVLLWNEGLCYSDVVFKAANNFSVDISATSQKFIGSVVSVLRGHVFGTEDIYIHVIKTKCMPWLFYGVDRL